MKNRMFGSKMMTVGMAVTLWVLCSGCVGEPYVYVPQNELKPGPGLFSGDDGEVLLIHNTGKIKLESDKGETGTDR